MRLGFEINGKPPKKSGANSLWTSDQVPLVIKLRLGAVEAAKKAQLRAFNSYIGIQFVLKVPRSQIESIGDLDNYIGGVLDGLQRAHPNVIPSKEFKAKGLEAIDPHMWYLISNDSKVLMIEGRKEIQSEGVPVSYRVSIESTKPNAKP